MKRFLTGILFVAACLQAWGQSDWSRIDSLIAAMLPEGSEVGISVYDLTEKKPLYTYRDTKLSRPASTMKLLTAVAFLSRADARTPFRTEVWHDGTIERDTLKGNLYVVGGFDPEFDDEAMDSLVSAVRAFPISVIDGQVYGDVSMKDSLYWGNGWAWDDNPEAYQPYLSPLMFCKGAVKVIAVPSAQQGDTARLVFTPSSSYYTADNRTKTRTPSAGKFSVSRGWLENDNRLVVKGNVASVRTGWVNLYHSESFFMHTFVERLHAAGVAAPASYAFCPLPPEGAGRIARWETPVQKVLDQLMKESDNLNAEALLCRLGAHATGKKGVAAEDGLKEVEALIRLLGHDPKSYKLADGSGLSNYNYLSPALLVDLLKYAYSRTDIFRSLYKSLPIAGIDGTLKFRMKKTAAAGNVHAKTGSFTAINALAGYLKRKNGNQVAFAIMNQNVFPAAKARAFQDKVCEVLVAE
ncbi:MAG: D-alanyl-D-alanine carboxypeptidase/D-alanyl-D-alanine-endopeptidase [Bacteroides pyogenes]|uniref:D-alanyl-D-alanine carboxypeptidase/D-alanyl-D-alanine endopeptidase n=1 Tax=Bacteroides pyogenes TaxID=310300 RepID=UPI002430DCF3|nr:D-alanyl-D-alanine carboxypeptidase/D-alanyl-D-alanine-endopeptidase [Bacteroides pyogenes]MCI7070538.1 D-alanyl-D-alanine carboxypeptidase/D-alanyl-D-alanine-endopeptidase [Bacteroides pyogenes]